MVNLGNRIRTLRLEKRISQTEMSQRIGVSKAMISSYELEQRSPSYEVLIKIAAFFNVTTDYLLGVEKERMISVEGLGDREMEVIANMVYVLREH